MLKARTTTQSAFILLILSTITALVVVVVDVADAISTDHLDIDLSHIRTCNETSPISLRTMNEVLINKKLTRGRESTPFKCFLHCLFTKYGWMDEDGGFLLHTIHATLDVSGVEITSLEYILYRCTAIESVDRCERAFEFTQCFWDKMAEPPQPSSPSEDQLFYNIINE